MATVDVAEQAALGRHDDPDEVNHLVCCCAEPLVAFCGYAADHVNLVSHFFCAMCMEEVNRRRPGWQADPVRICPIDATPCPTEREIDERIARLTS